MNKFCRFLSIVLVTVLIFTLSACGIARMPITADDFTSKLQDAGYTVIDETDKNAGGTTVLIAQSGDKQIEFYIFEDSSKTLETFNQIKERFIADKGPVVVNSQDVLINNYGFFTQTSAGKYNVVAFIDNTMVYAKVSDSNRSAVESIIDSLGYLQKSILR